MVFEGTWSTKGPLFSLVGCQGRTISSATTEDTIDNKRDKGYLWTKGKSQPRNEGRIAPKAAYST